MIVTQFSCKKTEDKIPPLPTESSANLPLRIKYLEEKTLENPKNDFAFYLLAKDYLKIGKFDQALLSIRKAILLKSKKKYMITLSECFYKKSQFLDAFDVLNQLDINDLSENEFTEKAIEIFLEAKNFTKANELIDNKLKIDSLNANLLFKKSEINLVSKDTNASILYCQKAIASDSNFKPALDKISQIYYETHNYVDAIKFATKSLKIDTFNTNINLIKANSLFLTGEKDKSMYYYSKILLQDSSQIEVLSRVADFYISKKNYSEAYFLLKRLENNAPNTKNINYNMATSLLYTGKHQEALEYYYKVDSTSAYFKNANYMIKKLNKRFKN